jgi:hypothetical protein
MSTFLELCKDVRRECRGIAGAGPITVVNQVGQLERVVNWVKNTWLEIQAERPDWRWMRSEFSLQTRASVDSYAYNDAGMTDSIAGAPISRFGRWWVEDFQFFLTSAGIGTRHSIPYQRWETWRKLWLTGNILPGYCASVSIDPRNALRLGCKPDGIYTLTGEYQKSAQILAADADVPEMPAQYHELITARAILRYGMSSAAPESIAMAQEIESRLAGPLYVDQVPPSRFGNPLC